MVTPTKDLEVQLSELLLQNNAHTKHIISMHKSKVDYQQENELPPGGRDICPLDGACLNEGVIYEIKVTMRDNRVTSEPS